jgi:hypothetical protein
LLAAVRDCHLDIVEGGHARRLNELVPPKNVAGLGLVRRDSMAYADEVSGKKTLFRTAIDPRSLLSFLQLPEGE